MINLLFFLALFLRKDKGAPESDLELVARYRKEQDMKDVGELFQRYTHLVYAVCMKYLKDEAACKDAVMEIFEKLIIDLKTHEVKNFKAWLHTVTRNHCLMQLRKAQSQLKKEEAYKKEEPGFVESGEELHLNAANPQEMQLTHLEQALENLKPEQKKCVELFYLQEKCYHEVAAVTGYTLKQVKSYIQNGKRNLKIAMTQLQTQQGGS